MKAPFILLLICSLAANIFFFVRSSRPRAAATNATSETAAATNRASIQASSSIAAVRLPQEFPSRIARRDAALAEELRNQGLPEFLVRALIRAEVTEQFAARELALFRHPKDVPYSSPNYSQLIYRPIDPFAAVDLYREKHELLASILGPLYRDDENKWDIRLAGLRPEVRETVRALAGEYDSAIQSLRNSGMQLKSERDKVAQLEKERREELSRLLTPTELEAFEFRAAPAFAARQLLDYFPATDAERKQVFQVYMEHMQKQGRTYSLMESVGYTPFPERDALDQQLKQVLGEARFADLKKASFYDAAYLHDVGERLQVPSEALNTAQAITQKARSEIEALESTQRQPGGSRAELDQKRAALAKEYEEGMRAAIGEKAYQVYARRSGIVRWLNPPVRPGPPKS
jgi:hypothetical protein